MVLARLSTSLSCKIFMVQNKQDRVNDVCTKAPCPSIIFTPELDHIKALLGQKRDSNQAQELFI